MVVGGPCDVAGAFPIDVAGTASDSFPYGPCLAAASGPPGCMKDALSPDAKLEHGHAAMLGLYIFGGGGQVFDSLSLYHGLVFIL